MTSASPWAIVSKACPTASMPPMQPVDRVTQGPWAPSRADRTVPGVFDMDARYRSRPAFAGSMGFRPSSVTARNSSSILGVPQIAVESEIPVRSAS